MKFPKFLEKTILSSANVKQTIQTKVNQQVVEEVQKALKAAKKDWAEETVKTMDDRFGKARRFVSSSGFQPDTQDLMSSTYESGKNYATLSTLFSDSPGSIQSAARIRDAVIGGGYVLKPPAEGVGTKGTKK